MAVKVKVDFSNAISAVYHAGEVLRCVISIEDEIEVYFHDREDEMIAMKSLAISAVTARLVGRLHVLKPSASEAVKRVFEQLSQQSTENRTFAFGGGQLDTGRVFKETVDSAWIVASMPSAVVATAISSNSQYEWNLPLDMLLTPTYEGIAVRIDYCLEVQVHSNDVISVQYPVYILPPRSLMECSSDLLLPLHIVSHDADHSWTSMEDQWRLYMQDHVIPRSLAQVVRQELSFDGGRQLMMSRAVMGLVPLPTSEPSVYTLVLPSSSAVSVIPKDVEEDHLDDIDMTKARQADDDDDDQIVLGKIFLPKTHVRLGQELAVHFDLDPLASITVSHIKVELLFNEIIDETLSQSVVTKSMQIVSSMCESTALVISVPAHRHGASVVLSPLVQAHWTLKVVFECSNQSRAECIVPLKVHVCPLMTAASFA